MNSENTKPDSDNDEQHPHCMACGAPAVVTGILQVGSAYTANAPLCEDCYVPTSELDVAEEQAEVVGGHTTELLTTPADEVFLRGETAIIDHGPGEQSRVRIPQ